jgi:glucan biosynthesis protein
MIARRALLKSALSLAAGSAGFADLSKTAQPSAAGAAPLVAGNGPALPFDFAWLKGQAHFLAGNVYQESKDVLPPAMSKLGYDQYQSIRFRGDHSLWGDLGLAFRLQFFHVGRTFNQPVHLHEVQEGQARERDQRVLAQPPPSLREMLRICRLCMMVNGPGTLKALRKHVIGRIASSLRVAEKRSAPSRPK